MPCVWFGAITIDGLICFEVGPNLASVFCWCCVISIFVLLVNVCSCCVMFSFFSTKSKDWLGIMSSGWCLLCVVGRKTLSQCSVSHRASTSSCWHYAFGAMCIAVYKAVCCHSNVTHAPIANPPSSAQLEDTSTIPRGYIWVRAVVWECGEDRQTVTRLWPIYITPRLCLTLNVVN